MKLRLRRLKIEDIDNGEIKLVCAVTMEDGRPVFYPCTLEFQEDHQTQKDHWTTVEFENEMVADKAENVGTVSEEVQVPIYRGPKGSKNGAS